MNIQKIVMTYINTQEPEALKNELQTAQTNEDALKIFKKYANK
jgi:hypothetical protein